MIQYSPDGVGEESGDEGLEPRRQGQLLHARLVGQGCLQRQPRQQLQRADAPASTSADYVVAPVKWARGGDAPAGAPWDGAIKGLSEDCPGRQLVPFASDIATRRRVCRDG